MIHKTEKKCVDNINMNCVFPGNDEVLRNVYWIQGMFTGYQECLLDPRNVYWIVGIFTGYKECYWIQGMFTGYKFIRNANWIPGM